MPFVVNEGVRLFYEVQGDGEPLLLLHGFTLDSRMWEPQFPVLTSRYRVIVTDTRGHGRSDAPPTGYSREERVDDVRLLADSLQLGRFHLVGFSQGGSTAIGFALKYQDRLKSLSLVSAGAAGYDVGPRIKRIDQLAREKSVEEARSEWLAMALRWFRPEHTEIAALMRTMISEHSGAYWSDPMRGKYPSIPDLDHVRKITVPTAIFIGESDKTFVPLARSLAERIPGARMYTYPRIGHMLNLEAAEKFNADLLNFLQTGLGATD